MLSVDVYLITQIPTLKDYLFNLIGKYTILNEYTYRENEDDVEDGIDLFNGFYHRQQQDLDFMIGSYAFK